MKAALPFRICAVVLVLFAIGHTYGFLSFRPPTPEAIAARAAMSDATFRFGSVMRSYADFYRGFGLFVTAYLLFAALLAWELPRLAASAPESFRVIAAGFLLVQLANVALAWIYFAAPQVVLSIIVAICAAWGMAANRSVR